MQVKKILVGAFYSIGISWLGFFHLACAATPASPAGYWQTIDDETGKARSIIQIIETPTHQLYGRIIQVSYFRGEKYTDVCNLCATNDPRHNKPNLGLIILVGMQPTKNSHVWDNGKVLDPHNGKVYDAKLTLSDEGNTLVLRGYIGISLLGRNQTWHRIPLNSLHQLLGTPMNTLSNGVLLTNKGNYLAAGYNSASPILQALHGK